MVLSTAHSHLVEDDANTSQRAKRIARPAHWKQHKPAAPSVAMPAPKRATAITAAPMVEAPQATTETEESAAQIATETWRDNPNFIMRTVACLCVLNFLLFTVFPENPLNLAMTDEMVVQPTERSILPENQRAEVPPTLYAPAPIMARPKPTTPSIDVERYAIDDSLRTPRWLRESAQ